MNSQGEYVTPGDIASKMTTLQRIKKINELIAHKDQVNSLVFSSDGKYLTSGSCDKKIVVWDIQDGKPYRILTGHSSAIQCLDFISEKGLLVSGDLDGNVIVWDIDKGRIIRSFVATDRLTDRHHAQISGIKLKKGTTMVTIVGDDDHLRIWDYSRGCELIKYKGELDSIWDKCVFSTDGKRLVTVGLVGSLYVWDEGINGSIRNWYIDGTEFCSSTAVAISSDGTLVAYWCFSDPLICLFDINLNKKIKRLPFTDPIRGERFKLKGPDALTEAYMQQEEGENETVIDFSDSDYSCYEDPYLENEEEFIRVLAITIDNRYLLGGNKLGELFMVDLVNGHYQGKLKAHDSPVKCLSFAPGQKIFASSDSEGDIVLWTL